MGGEAISGECLFRVLRRPWGEVEELEYWIRQFGDDLNAGTFLHDLLETRRLCFSLTRPNRRQYFALRHRKRSCVQRPEDPARWAMTPSGVAE